MSANIRVRWERAIRIAYRALQRKESFALKSPSQKEKAKEEETYERHRVLPSKQ